VSESPPELDAYYDAGKSLLCDLDESPFLCEFWPKAVLRQYNKMYEVETNAPGYFGFATSGGGEMFAISPVGSVVCLPFIGMHAEVAMTIAPTWAAFERKLRNAL
jgi:hypothetical protein